MKLKLFNEEVTEKVKNAWNKSKEWVTENPEFTFVGAACAAYALIVGDYMRTNSVSRKCEKQRTKAYINRLERD